MNGETIILDGQALGGETCEESLAASRANEVQLIEKLGDEAPYPLTFGLSGGCLIIGILLGVYSRRW